MTYPTAAVTTTNLDAGTDSPATARSDLLDAVQKLNQMIAHTSSFAATLLDDTTAAAARTTLSAAASGANVDITSLGNNTSTIYTTAGTSTAYTITPTPAIAAYAAGQSFVVNFNAACGASPTLQISGIATPPNLVKENPDGTFSNLAASDVPINHRSRVTLISTTQALVERTSAGIIASGAAPVFGARAFCTWNGATTGTYAPTLPSGNISSIAKNGAGLYTLNFSTAMDDAEYAVTWGADAVPTMGIAQSAQPLMGVVSKQPGWIQVQFYSYVGSTNIPTGLDVTRAHIAIFR